MHIKYLPLVDETSTQEQNDVGEQNDAERKTNGGETKESEEQNAALQTTKDEATAKAANALNDQARWTQVRAHTNSRIVSVAMTCREPR